MKERVYLEYDTIRYDIYLLQLVLHPVAVDHTHVHNRRTLIYIRRNNTDHRTHKIQNKTYKKYNNNNTYAFLG